MVEQTEPFDVSAHLLAATKKKRAPRRWQVSIKTILLIAMVSGPLAGGYSGRFGKPLQEVMLMMTSVGLISLGLAVLATVCAFIILSPLLVVERFLRRAPSRQSRTVDYEETHSA